MTVIKHGTYAGWNAHMTTGEPMCMDCREAQRQYQTAHRRKEQARKRDRMIVSAGVQAKQQLAKNHPEEYRQLYEYFKTKLAAGKKVTS